ncbi:MAG: TolC family protein, partial [Bacteroidota bacterium]
MYKQVIISLLLLPGLGRAQSVLPLEQAMSWALENHPVAEMARAVEAQGAAALLRSKGAFDPKVAANYDLKEFKGLEYFNYGTAGVEWQSPYAVKVAAGYDWARGEFLAEDLTLSSGTQAYLAVKLPLLQGLITDAARIGRKRGDIAVDQQKAIAEIIRNELRFDVAHRYAEWLFAERSLRINEETEVLIETYLRDTRTLFELGDKPGIDTLEAFIYLGTQRLATQQARVDAQIAKLAFSEMYWPLEVEDEPVALDPTYLEVPLVPEWEAAQPELRDLQLLVS